MNRRGYFLNVECWECYKQWMGYVCAHKYLSATARTILASVLGNTSPEDRGSVISNSASAIFDMNIYSQNGQDAKTSWYQIYHIKNNHNLFGDAISQSIMACHNSSKWSKFCDNRNGKIFDNWDRSLIYSERSIQQQYSRHVSFHRALCQVFPIQLGCNYYERQTLQKK